MGDLWVPQKRRGMVLVGGDLWAPEQSRTVIVRIVHFKLHISAISYHCCLWTIPAVNLQLLKSVFSSMYQTNTTNTANSHAPNDMHSSRLALRLGLRKKKRSYTYVVVSDGLTFLRTADLRTHTGNNFMSGTLCSLPILHVQQFSNEPGTATGVNKL